MAKEVQGHLHTTEEESHSASPKPRLTRIRSLLESNSPRAETKSSNTAPNIQRISRPPTFGTRDFYSLRNRARNAHPLPLPVATTTASQTLSQEVTSLSRQPTLELIDMGDSADKPSLMRRRSSRLVKVPSASLTMDEICTSAPTPEPSEPFSVPRSITRSLSRSKSRSMSRSMSRSTSMRTKTASSAEEVNGDADEEDVDRSKSMSRSVSRSKSRTMTRSTSLPTKTASNAEEVNGDADEEDVDRSKSMSRSVSRSKSRSISRSRSRSRSGSWSRSGSPSLSSPATGSKDDEEDMEVDAADPGPSTVSPPALPTAGPSDPFGPNAIELVISFDTTGSMSSCINEVRKCVQDLVQRLFMDIPNLRISIIAHGDYCDESTYYLVKHVDFTNDVASLCTFVKDVEGSGGGDFDECYEYVLHYVREMNWTPGTQRALVMIGDATPHEPDYALNKQNLDWRVEADKLGRELGVRIYAVQCQNNGNKVIDFYKSLAARTCGQYLQLNKFSSIVNILMAICYAEKGAEFFEAFEREVREREGRHLATEMDNVFDTLRAPGTSKPKKTYDLSKGASKKSRAKPKPDGLAGKKSPKRLTPAEKKAAKEARTVSGTKSRSKITKIYREKLPMSKFILNKLRWSRWRPMMSSRVADSSLWVPNSGAMPGTHHKRVFVTDTTLPTVYEFAIQRRHRSKRFVMYTACSTGYPENIDWFKKCFRKKTAILTELESLMNSSGLLSVRRAVLPRSCTVKLENGNKVQLKKPRDYRNILTKVYDYAWQVGARKPLRSKRFPPSS